MSGLYEDLNWPRASAWLAGELAPDRPTARLSVIGVPLHLGSITPGRCDLAPAAIRRALDRYSPYNASRNCDLSRLEVLDLGDLDVSGLQPDAAFEPVRSGVHAALNNADAVVILGGDNSITRPSARALGECGLITFDAHFDLRDLGLGLTNGNPIRALLGDGMPGRRIVQIGIQSYANSKAYGDIARESGITSFTAEHVRLQGIEQVVAQAFDIIGDLPVYVDLDIDVLDRSYAPAAPGSRPGGLHPWEIRQAARLCGANRRVRAMDLVEIDPEKDINDTTCLAAAACLLEFASGVFER
jgi:formiminoglutamase